MPMTGSVVKRESVYEEFEWKIENFTLTEGSYWTPEFKFRNETWQFFMFPQLSGGYIGLRLCRHSSDSLMNVEISVALKTSDGQKSFERGVTDIFDEFKYTCDYQWMKRSEFERRKSEFLSSRSLRAIRHTLTLTEFVSSGCLTVMIALKRVDFVEPASRRHFFRSKYIPMNKNNSAPVSHESLTMSTTRDAVQKENAPEEFEWKIEHFSLIEGAYRSPQFTFRSETWEFAMFPHSSDEYIGLGVGRNSLAYPLLVEFSVALKTSDGQKLFERVWTEMFDEWKLSGRYNWMRRSEFEGQQTEFLSSGCLKIIITLKNIDAVEPARIRILQDYKEMFLSQENCDVVLKVKGREFSAHNNILMARSPVLASTFRNDMKEKESGVVEIEDIDPSSFSEFLCFLYCGQIDNLSEENAHGLFTAADKYDIPDLRAMCVDFMKEHLSIDGFCETLVLALLHTETGLIKACTDFFIRNAEEIIESDKWKSFADENPKQSNELFTKYVKSHSSKCRHESPCPKKRKLTLE